jgi:hypothetical protein
METMVDIGLRRGFCETSYLVGLVFVLIKNLKPGQYGQFWNSKRDLEKLSDMDPDRVQ